MGAQHQTNGPPTRISLARVYDSPHIGSGHKGPAYVEEVTPNGSARMGYSDKGAAVTGLAAALS
jgi:hypothetical protein